MFEFDTGTGYIAAGLSRIKYDIKHTSHFL